MKRLERKQEKERLERQIHQQMLKEQAETAGSLGYAIDIIEQRDHGKRERFPYY